MLHLNMKGREHGEITSIKGRLGAAERQSLRVKKIMVPIKSQSEITVKAA